MLEESLPKCLTGYMSCYLGRWYSLKIKESIWSYSSGATWRLCDQSCGRCSFTWCPCFLQNLGMDAASVQRFTRNFQTHHRDWWHYDCCAWACRLVHIRVHEHTGLDWTGLDCTVTELMLTDWLALAMLPWRWSWEVGAGVDCYWKHEYSPASFRTTFLVCLGSIRTLIFKRRTEYILGHVQRLDHVWTFWM